MKAFLVRTLLARAFLTLIVICLPVSAFAAIDTYEFKTEELRERFQQLTFDLRCPKCQNQNLQDSNAGIAADMRNKIYSMLQEGSSDAEIYDFMVARYGDFVLYRPPVKPLTYALWYGPFILVVLGLCIIFFVARLRKKATNQGVDLETNLTDAEHERLKKILDKGTDA